MPQDDSSLGPSRRTVLAAERTWLAWFRTGIGVAAAGIAVGGVIPRLTDSTSIPYVVLGVGFSLLAVAIFALGWQRQRTIYRALEENADLPTGLASIFSLTLAGGLLAIAAAVLLLAEL